MEMEMCKLHKRLEERNSQLHASASAAEKVYSPLNQIFFFNLHFLNYVIFFIFC